LHLKHNIRKKKGLTQDFSLIIVTAEEVVGVNKGAVLRDLISLWLLVNRYRLVELNDWVEDIPRLWGTAICPASCCFNISTEKSISTLAYLP
jgi:hypothetical protein